MTNHTNVYEQPPRHAKLTDHFLAAMGRMPKTDRLAFLEALERGAFDRAATRANLIDVKGAACMGQSFVVFKIDSHDRRVLAFLTVLDLDKSRVIARRRDTKVVPL